MRSKLILGVFLLTVLLAALLLTDCREAVEEEAAVDESETTAEPVVIRLAGVNAGYPTPFAHYPRMRGTVMKYLFDSLLEIDETGYIPWLAESWETCDEGTTHLVTIREGVKWHDGEDLTVEDVVFSFRYYQQHPPVFIGEVVQDSAFLVEIEAAGDNQVRFVTAEPSGTFYGEAGAMRIIPKHIWENVDDPYSFTGPEAVIGCGPYILTDYSQEHNSYRYEAFADYWSPRHRVQVIEYIPVSDSVLALENNKIDLSRIPPDVVSRFSDNPDYVVMESPALAGYMLSFNMHQNEIFRSREFRQAVAYAVDRDELIEKVARGAAKPGSPGILPVDHQWYNPGLPRYGHDPDKALALLESLGIDGGLTLELLVGEGPEVRIGEVLKEQLSRVGLDLQVVSVDGKTRDARGNEGQYQVALLHMGSWGLDADFLRVRYSSSPAAGGSATAILGADQGYVNPDVDELLQAQLYETDQEKRKELFFRIQVLLAEDVPEIPLYNGFYYYAYRPAKYDGWTFMFDHPVTEHAKLSYLERN